MKEDVVYARQSLFKKDSISISSQIDLCCKAAGISLKEYKDAGYSGKNTSRPDFQRLIKDVKADKIRTLYVYRLDRFSRSVADFSQLWEVLQEHNVEFVSVSENFDTKTPMGRAMLQIIMIFAQLERETTAERVKDNYYRRVTLGNWPGGPGPYGFDVIKLPGPDGKLVSQLIPNEKIQTVIQIFQEYAEDGVSLSKLARKLTTDGVPGAKRDAWDNVAVSRILHNPAYVKADEEVRLHYLSLGAKVASPEEAFDGTHGAVLVGRRKASDRKYTRYDDHTISVLQSEGVISSELWLKCQAKLAHNQQIGNNGKGTNTWLSGLLKCASCGYALKVLKENQYRWLVCSGRYNMHHCDSSIHVKLSELEAAVQEGIERLLDECPIEAPTVQDPDPFAPKLAELERRADRLMDAFAENENLPPDYLQRAIARIEKEREDILEAQARQKMRVVLPEKLIFANLSFDEKKLVASQFIKRINVEEHSAEIVWNV